MDNRPVLNYILIAIILLISIGAIPSAIKIIQDPTGKLIQFPDNYLKNTAFRDYLIPGVILLIVIGILPLFLAYGLLRRDSLKFLNNLSIYRDKNWQFSFLMYYSFALLIWIQVQTIFVPYFFLQTAISCIGILILILSLFPSIRNYYSIQRT